MINQTTIGSAE